MLPLRRCTHLAWLFAIQVLSMACFDVGPHPFKDEIFPEAYIPVYGVDSSSRVIRADLPQPTIQAGKIYVQGTLLYQVEVFKGIHIIDYSDKDRPVKLAFIHIPGCSEVTVRKNVLLTNNMNDLVSVDLTRLPEVTVFSRVTNAFNVVYFYNETAVNAKPPYSGVHYVCPNGFSGDVVGWTLGKDVPAAYCVTN